MYQLVDVLKGFVVYYILLTFLQSPNAILVKQ